MARYNGFSTIDTTHKFKLTDFDLVKRDIQNHFAIRKGEKLMDPDYGTIIYNMIFEPLNQDTKNTIVQDIKRIIGADPRVAAKNVLVTEFEKGIQIELELIYLNTNQVGKIIANFNRTSK